MSYCQRCAELEREIEQFKTAAQELERQVTTLGLTVEGYSTDIRRLAPHGGVKGALAKMADLESRLALAQNSIVNLGDGIAALVGYTGPRDGDALTDAVRGRLAKAEHEVERLLRDPTTAEVARLRSVVNERDVEQARLQRELNLRREMLIAAIGARVQAEAAVAAMREALLAECEAHPGNLYSKECGGCWTANDKRERALSLDAGRAIHGSGIAPAPPVSLGDGKTPDSKTVAPDAGHCEGVKIAYDALFVEVKLTRADGQIVMLLRGHANMSLQWPSSAGVEPIRCNGGWLTAWEYLPRWPGSNPSRSDASRPEE